MQLLRQGSEITELTGTAEWTLWQKQTLASMYYAQVRSNPAFDPAELVPVEQFWLNPLHGRTAQIGPNRGDIELVDLGRFLTRAQKNLQGHAEKLVRMFRLNQSGLDQ